MARRSLVLELQELATDKNNDVVDLLRKALLVATKLDLNEFRQWVNCELHGYDDGTSVPRYRKVRATIQAFNPGQGRLIPFLLPDDVAIELCNVSVQQSIGSLVDLTHCENERILMPLGPQVERFLLESQGDVRMKPVRSVPRNMVVNIVEGVRSTVLEWALRLEQEGILGEGLTFSREEKRKAASSLQIHVAGNFQGIAAGTVAGSDIKQTLRMTVTQGDLVSLRRNLQAVGVEPDAIAELEQAIGADPRPKSKASFGERVGGWIGKMVSKAAQGLTQLPVETASNLLANAIWQYYGFGAT